jgi:primary-amine oxidase
MPHVIARRLRVTSLLPLLLVACRASLHHDGDGDVASAAIRGLEPLTRAEHDAVRAILVEAGELPVGMRLVSVELDEPSKDELDALRSGAETAASPPRRASVVTFDRAANTLVTLDVDITAGAVIARRTVAGAQPMMGDEDFDLAEKLVRADQRWRDAMKKRGIADLDEVHLDVWAPGSQPVPGAGNVRLARALSNFKGKQKNPYGPPIEGVVAVVDLTHEKVLSVSDTVVAPLSRTSTDFFDARVRGAERGLAFGEEKPGSSRMSFPLDSPGDGAAGRAPGPVQRPDAQRDGTGARIMGNTVAWAGWTLAWSFHDREGLVLHDVRCDGRSILHRASISEMWVPYGDPDPGWSWRNAFDSGEYGMGNLAHALEAGRDVPSDAMLLEGGAEDGDPVVAIWEQDGGLLWTHDGPETITRRGRELVLGFVSTVGNYDYAFRWVLALDGAMRFETDLSGILLTKGSQRETCGACDAAGATESGTIPDGDERYGTLVADRVVAIHHQHFIALRLDFDVDGRANSVRECDVEADPGRGPGFVARRTTLASEKVAGRNADASKHRTWEVFNERSRNAQGHARGYTIVPGATAVPYADADSPERRLARFADHVVWVTRHEESERFAAGDWPSQARVPGGLATFAEDDEPLVGQDVVVWYVLGLTHIPRPEDYPIMPAARAHVSFVPTGFFDRNPALGR